MSKAFQNLVLEYDETHKGYKILSIAEGTVELVVPEFADDGLPIVSVTSEAFLSCASTLRHLHFSKNLTALYFTHWNRASFRNVDSIVVDPENPAFDSREDCNALIHTKRNLMVFGCKNTTFPDSIVDIADPATKELYVARTFPKKIAAVDIAALAKKVPSIDFKGYESVKLRRYLGEAYECEIHKISILLDEHRPQIDVYEFAGSGNRQDQGKHTLIDIEPTEENLRLLSYLVSCVEEALHYDKGESPYGAAAYYEYVAELHTKTRVLKTRNQVLTAEILALFHHFYPLDDAWRVDLCDLSRMEYLEDVETEIKD